MIQSRRFTEDEWRQRAEKILAALVRARSRAKDIARQTGTPLVYERGGKIVREFVGTKETE